MKMLELTQSQMPEIYRIMRQLRPQLSLEKMAAKLQSMQNGGYKLFGFMQNDEIVALCGTMPFDVLYREDCLYICDLVVAENMRGSGIGGRFLSEVESWAKSQGYKQIELSSGFAREMAHKFYEKMNYKKVSFVFLKDL